MSSVHPGKGVMLFFEDGMADWFSQVADEVRDVVANYEEEYVIEELVDTYQFEHVEDNFGDKAYKTFKLASGNEFRITVVRSRRGLRLDVREWFVP